ncbi:hypothetical protein K525DRAFT_195816 [Schizophyllum commune Loenen D]|nr:hypothetical protein K525DRAFT_195816 [Schizophyllum commune Loenen D]
MLNIIILSILNGLLYGVGLSALMASPLAVVVYIIVFTSTCHIVLHLIARVPRLLQLLHSSATHALSALQANATAELHCALATNQELEAKYQELLRAHSETEASEVELKEKLRCALAKIEQLEADKHELGIKTQEQEAELVDARDTIADYPLLALAARFQQSDIRLLKHENKQLKSQNETLKSKTKDLRSELLTVKREKRETEHKLHTQIRTLENDKRVLQRGLDGANSFIATNREVNIAERAELRMQAEEALMQLEANKRQMAKHEGELDAQRNSFELQLNNRAHIISNLELAVENYREREQDLCQCNDDLRERNRDLRLRHNALQRQMAEDAVALSRLRMALSKGREPSSSFPSSNNTATAQAGASS